MAGNPKYFGTGIDLDHSTLHRACLPTNAFVGADVAEIRYDSSTEQIAWWTSLGSEKKITDITLNSFANPTASVNLNNKKIINLATPTSANDAVNKAYIDSIVLSSNLNVYVGEGLPPSVNMLWIKPSRYKTFIYDLPLNVWISTDSNNLFYGSDFTNVTNQYLKYNGLNYSNIIAFKALYPLVITDIVVTSDNNNTWNLEFRNETESVYPSGTFNIPTSSTIFNGQTFQLTTNDVLRLYANGTSLSRPHVDIYYREIIIP